MVDKTKKLLRKLSKKDFQMLKEVYERLKNKDTDGMNITKVAGTDEYRVRKGSFRIRFRYEEENNVKIINTRRKNEKTYK